MTDQIEALRQTAEGLLGQSVRAISPARMSGNNRLFKLEANTGQFALKCYPTMADDPRDRLGTEWAALEFMARHKILSVPRPIACDPDQGLAIYSWVDGMPISACTPIHINAALEFIGSLHDQRTSTEASSLKPASEACLSGRELSSQVQRRLDRLSATGDPQLTQLLAELYSAYEKFSAPVLTEGDIDQSCRTLSPSDFGFHNALQQGDGGVVFLDFEYFGWDDPVKLTADTLLHPGMALGPDQRAIFLSGFKRIFDGDPDFSQRLSRHYPLYVLRWCAIILNEFLPQGWARRQSAGATDWESAKARQLAKAEALWRHEKAAFGTGGLAGH